MACLGSIQMKSNTVEVEENALLSTMGAERSLVCVFFKARPFSICLSKALRSLEAGGGVLDAAEATAGAGGGGGGGPAIKLREKRKRTKGAKPSKTSSSRADL
jgi:hypothetical protein